MATLSGGEQNGQAKGKMKWTPKFYWDDIGIRGEI